MTLQEQINRRAKAAEPGTLRPMETDKVIKNIEK